MSQDSLGRCGPALGAMDPLASTHTVTVLLALIAAAVVVSTFLPDPTAQKFIRQGLELTSGNQVRAAKLLGLGKDALCYRMMKHGCSRRSVATALGPATLRAVNIPSRHVNVRAWLRERRLSECGHESTGRVVSLS